LGPAGERRFFGDAHWNEPRKWNKAAREAGVRKRVFCASMADVFEARDDLNGERLRLWQLIEETPWLDWQLLTKRPENIAKILTARWLENPRPNVWIGTTVEDQKRADERIEHLLRTYQRRCDSSPSSRCSGRWRRERPRRAAVQPRVGARSREPVHRRRRARVREAARGATPGAALRQGRLSDRHTGRGRDAAGSSPAEQPQGRRPCRVAGRRCSLAEGVPPMMHHSCLIPGCGRRGMGARTKQFCAHHMAKISRDERLAIAAHHRRLQLGVPRRYPMPVEFEEERLQLGGSR
jgi:hypothetical protein